MVILASTIKGWLFVVATSLLLYALIRRLRDQALAAYSCRQIYPEAATQAL